ncbi:hypothetical protein BE04_49015 [Sorangium cellulosum]|uniref:STAS domain-containing protein n=2 Tax=Sorangium cellulosum TaxID=56 RepID=A0A150PWN7_SORCE|nr:hypothetical protein [Sorangium cellulosum]AGP38015.1 hypothetical protein SCE1572_28205 [Sorangium cellulosum So0157-2]KYF60221.1 hypothetical protein BE04_49015 [Sorangium cellulosum]
MLEILRNAHYTVTIDPAAQLARVTRSAAPSESAFLFEERWMEVSRALDRAGRSGLCLLVDLREAVGRNDPLFEAAMQRVRPAVMSGFRRVAVLVRTTAGALQIQRHVREDGIDRMIGSDEAQLLDYLREGRPRGR